MRYLLELGRFVRSVAAADAFFGRFFGSSLCGFGGVFIAARKAASKRRLASSSV